MRFSEISSKLQSYKEELAEFSHQEVSLVSNQIRQTKLKEQKEPRLAGVLVLIYKKKGLPHFVLTQRHEYQGTHSNQISLPGGKFEESDANLEATALRETHEEIGVVLDNQGIIKLGDVYIPPSNFLMSPYVRVINSEIEFKSDEYEVKNIIEVPISDLINTALIQKPISELDSKSRVNFKTSVFMFGTHLVWGATAMVINELRNILLK